MGYLAMALAIVGEGSSDKKAQTQQAFPETKGEKSEKSELKRQLKTLPDLSRVYQDFFEQAVAYVSTQYIPGALEMIREDFTDLDKEIQEAEDQINLLWLLLWKEAGDLPAFRDAVDRWKRLHMMKIRIFRFLESTN